MEEKTTDPHRPMLHHSKQLLLTIQQLHLRHPTKVWSPRRQSRHRFPEDDGGIDK